MTKLTKPVVRELDNLIVTLTPQGLLLREKKRRLTVGPLSFFTLYERGVQTAAGLAPLAPRKPRKR